MDKKLVFKILETLDRNHLIEIKQNVECGLGLHNTSFSDYRWEVLSFFRFLPNRKNNHFRLFRFFINRKILIQDIHIIDQEIKIIIQSVKSLIIWKYGKTSIFIQHEAIDSSKYA